MMQFALPSAVSRRILRKAASFKPTMSMLGSAPRVCLLQKHPDGLLVRSLTARALPSSNTMDTLSSPRFCLDTDFVASFQERRPPFGFNGLGEVVYQRTYARVVPSRGAESEERLELWYETVERVVNGTFDMQKNWIESQGLVWDDSRAQSSARRMYELMFGMKFLPPGRGLWAMGSPITTEKSLFAALNNCAFVSTGGDEIARDPCLPFVFLMDASMLGIGVGFDTKAAGSISVVPPAAGESTYVIPDSREGWVESLRVLLLAYFRGQALPSFDYSKIRPAGAPIRGFGGISAGPSVLQEMHQSIESVLEKLVGKELTVTAVVDIMNIIGRCVVSGNVRRTAEIAFGDPDSEEYIDLKDYAKNPQRADFGWTSNNSVFARLGMDYAPACERIRTNGEPGFAWLDNMQNYGRMGDVPDGRDYRVSGGNPCLEQSLESFEMCCLVETFPAAHEDIDEYRETLRYAFLYAKTVTLGKTHWAQTNEKMLRNRRIGCSMSGIAQFIAKRGLHELKEWCEAGYAEIQDTDDRLSEWMAIPRSIKTTSIKPSGTVSLLAGATPGMHFPESRFYLRRIRMGVKSPLLGPLMKAGFPLEPAIGDEERSVVASFPVDSGEGVRTTNEVSMWEQLGLAAFLQRYWSDNQVSCTVTFDPEKEAMDLKHALDMYQYQLKGVSFLPKLKTGAYEQMPYEEISEDQYAQAMKTIDLDLLAEELERQSHGGKRALQQPTPEKFCDNDVCEL